MRSKGTTQLPGREFQDARVRHDVLWVDASRGHADGVAASSDHPQPSSWCGWARIARSDPAKLIRMVALTVLITGAFLQDRIIVRPPQVTCRKRMTIDPVRFRHPGKKFHRPTRGHGNARQPRHPVAVRRSATIAARACRSRGGSVVWRMKPILFMKQSQSHDRSWKPLARSGSCTMPSNQPTRSSCWTQAWRPSPLRRRRSTRTGGGGLVSHAVAAEAPQLFGIADLPADSMPTDSRTRASITTCESFRFKSAREML